MIQYRNKVLVRRVLAELDFVLEAFARLIRCPSEEFQRLVSPALIHNLKHTTASALADLSDGCVGLECCYKWPVFSIVLQSSSGDRELQLKLTLVG